MLLIWISSLSTNVELNVLEEAAFGSPFLFVRSIYLDRETISSILVFMFSTGIRLRGGESLSDAIAMSLGELERKTLFALRDLGEANVNTVNLALGDIYAYTTVMTTLDRLYKKGLLERRKDGRAFLYRIRYSFEEMEQGLARDVIGRLLETATGPVEPVLACIVESVSERDIELLDDLERLVREKRQELDKLRADAD